MLLRGTVILTRDIAGTSEPKPYVVVSSNRRNKSNFPSVLVVRITTTYKYDTLPSVVRLPDGESFSGYVRCDDIEPLYRNDDTYQVVGSLSPHAMGLIDDGLRASLDL